MIDRSAAPTAFRLFDWTFFLNIQESQIFLNFAHNLIQILQEILKVDTSCVQQSIKNKTLQECENALTSHYQTIISVLLSFVFFLFFCLLVFLSFCLIFFVFLPFYRFVFLSFCLFVCDQRVSILKGHSLCQNSE